MRPIAAFAIWFYGNSGAVSPLKNSVDDSDLQNRAMENRTVPAFVLFYFERPNDHVSHLSWETFT